VEMTAFRKIRWADVAGNEGDEGGEEVEVGEGAEVAAPELSVGAAVQLAETKVAAASEARAASLVGSGRQRSQEAT
jgi:hypothetical protein